MNTKTMDGCAEDVTVQIAVLGPSKVGKTALINQYVNKIFIQKHSETIEDLYKKGDVKSSGCYISLDIVDTSGSCMYNALRKQVIRKSDVFVLVFSLTDKTSFKEMRQIREQIVSAQGSSAPILVVGNKSDLMGKRILRYKTAKAFVEQCWKHVYLECASNFYDDTARVFEKTISLLPLGTTFRQRARTNGGKLFVMSCSRGGGVDWKRLC